MPTEADVFDALKYRIEVDQHGTRFYYTKTVCYTEKTDLRLNGRTGNAGGFYLVLDIITPNIWQKRKVWACNNHCACYN